MFFPSSEYIMVCRNDYYFLFDDTLLINMSKNMQNIFICGLLFGSVFIFNHFFNILNVRLILFFQYSQLVFY